MVTPSLVLVQVLGVLVVVQFLVVLVHFQLRALWRACHLQLEQFGAELKRQHRIRRVFLLGGSMGGTACLTFAALHPELVDGVASFNGTANLVEYTNFPDAIAASFGGGKTAVPDEYKKRSAEFWPERFTMPVAIMVGGKDAVVPPHSAVRLAGALKKRGRDVLLIQRAEVGHWTNYDDVKALLEFVIQKSQGDRAATQKTTTTD